MLASDEVTITIDRETVYLRPTLRAATRLERKYDGFDKIVKAIADENLTVIASVIQECSTYPSSIPKLIEAIGTRSFAHGVGVLIAPLIALVFQLAGFDEDKAPTKPQDDAPAKRIAFAEHHARLFKLATGWLLWTPETAWNATPVEIIAAYEGRVEYLKAIYGAGDKEPEPELDLDTQFKLALAKFPTRVINPDEASDAG